VKTANAHDNLKVKASQLATLATELGLGELAETIRTDTRRRLSEERIRVVVLGEIKQGKSTLINALIGDDVLPTGVTPTTGAIVVVREGPAPGRYLAGPGGARESLDEAQFKSLAIGQTKPGDEQQIEVVVTGGALPDAIEVIDTPGMNDMKRVRGAISRGELPRADVLVVVLDATQLLNRTEMAFLRDAVSAVGGLTGSGARLLLVINRIDLIAQNDRPMLVEHLEREVAAVAGADGKASVEIFQTDARGANRRPDDDTLGVAEVRRLRARLSELAGQANEMLPARARASLLRHCALVAHNAAIASRAATLESAQLRKEIRAVEKDLVGHESDLVKLRGDLDVAKRLLLTQSRERIDAYEVDLLEATHTTIRTANQRTLSTLLPGSLHDALLAFTQEEASRLRTELDDLTTKALRTHGEQARRRLFHATLRLGFRGPPIYIDPPSVVLEAGLVAIGLAGTAVMYFGSMGAGLAMTIAGPLTTVFLRERSLRVAREQARAMLPEALASASQAMADGIERVVDRHIQALDEHLVLANVALGEQLRDVLANAQARLGEDSGDEAGTQRRADAIGRYQGIERTLGQLRRELDSIPPVAR
jgi:small GTP-binding protein